LSAGRYLTIIFAANATAFALLGWLLERWGDEQVNWGRVVGVALLMGVTTADVARRFSAAEAGEMREGFASYRSGTRWILVLWASLAAAFAVSAALVSAFA
jgi:hypothetical protein